MAQVVAFMTERFFWWAWRTLSSLSFTAGLVLDRLFRTNTHMCAFREGGSCYSLPRRFINLFWTREKLIKFHANIVFFFFKKENLLNLQVFCKRYIVVVNLPKGLKANIKLQYQCKNLLHSVTLENLLCPRVCHLNPKDKKRTCQCTASGYSTAPLYMYSLLTLPG